MPNSYSIPLKYYPDNSEEKFLNWIFSRRENIYYIAVTVFLSIAIWTVFKFYFPYPNIIFDSYYYVWAAAFNDKVSAWPIGYSKFIQFIGILSHSATILLIIQYVLLQLSFLYFFLSLVFLFRPEKWGRWLLLCFLLLNPIYIFTCNLVLSDALFLSLSLIWIANLLWIVISPKVSMLVIQALLLLAAFSVRHSAVYYPFIACLGIILSGLSFKWKLAGVFLQLSTVGVFILYTIHMNEKEYGVKQFSPFQSWKVASNALYVYENVPKNEISPVPEAFKSLDSMVIAYYHSKHEPVSLFLPDPSWGSYYIFMYPSPLLRYKDKLYPNDGRFLINVPVFSKMGPLYKAYGSWILKHYPVTYAKYFVFPNIWFYIVPYPEVYSDSYNPFNLQSDTIGKVTRKWFGLKTISVQKDKVELRTQLFNHYPIVNTCIHIVFLLNLMAFVFLKGYRNVKKAGLLAIAVVVTLWITNFVFIIMASASLLRYQLFITIVEGAFAMLLWNIIFKIKPDTGY